METTAILQSGTIPLPMEGIHILIEGIGALLRAKGETAVIGLYLDRSEDIIMEDLQTFFEALVMGVMDTRGEIKYMIVITMVASLVVQVELGVRGKIIWE